MKQMPGSGPDANGGKSDQADGKGNAKGHGEGRPDADQKHPVCHRKEQHKYRARAGAQANNDPACNHLPARLSRCSGAVGMMVPGVLMIVLMFMCEIMRVIVVMTMVMRVVMMVMVGVSAVITAIIPSLQNAQAHQRAKTRNQGI